MSEYSPEIPMIIKRCLIAGKKILPHELPAIINQFNLKTIPTPILWRLSEEQLDKYITGLKLCDRHDASEWTKGYDLLKELGFKEKRREEGHTTFVSLVWE